MTLEELKNIASEKGEIIEEGEKELDGKTYFYVIINTELTTVEYLEEKDGS